MQTQKTLPSGKRGKNAKKWFSWKKTATKNNRLLVPLSYENNYSLGLQGWRTAVFSKDQSGRIRMSVLELAADDEYFKKNNGKIDKKNFTGSIVEYDGTGEFIYGLRWENGKAVGQVTRFESELVSSSKPSSSGRTNGCGYQYTYAVKVNGTYQFNVVWVQQQCWAYDPYQEYIDWAAYIDYQYISAYDAQEASNKEYECFQIYKVSCEEIRDGYDETYIFDGPPISKKSTKEPTGGNYDYTRIKTTRNSDFYTWDPRKAHGIAAVDFEFDAQQKISSWQVRITPQSSPLIGVTLDPNSLQVTISPDGKRLDFRCDGVANITSPVPLPNLPSAPAVQYFGYVKTDGGAAGSIEIFFDSKFIY